MKRPAEEEKRAFLGRLQSELRDLPFSQIRSVLLITPHGLPWLPDLLKVFQNLSSSFTRFTLLTEEGRQGSEAGVETLTFHRTKRGTLRGRISLWRKIAQRRFDLILFFIEADPFKSPVNALRLALFPARHRQLCSSLNGRCLSVSGWRTFRVLLRPQGWFSEVRHRILPRLFQGFFLTMGSVVLRFLVILWEPICWLAGRRKPSSIDQIQRILFIALDLPGDVLLTTPVLHALKERFPSATITVLAGQWAEELLSPHPAVSKVIPFNAPWFARYVAHLSHRPIRPIRDLLQCLLSLWQGRFDLTVETRGEAVHILLAYLSGAPHRVGYALWSVLPWLKAQVMAPLLTHRVPYPWENWQKWHKVEFNLNVVRSIGATPKDPSPVLSIPFSAERSIRDFLDRHGVEKDTLLIGAHPGASQERKRWPPVCFAEVLDRLVERWDARVVVMGSPQEQGVAEELMARMAHPCIWAVGWTSLLKVSALVQRCQLVICNDSLIVHIASCVKAPVVSLSRSPSNFYAPFRTQGISLTRRLACMNRGTPEGCICPFSEFWCLQEVTPEEVLRAAEELLTSRATRGGQASQSAAHLVEGSLLR